MAKNSHGKTLNRRKEELKYTRTSSKQTSRMLYEEKKSRGNIDKRKQPGTGAARNTSQVARDHFGGDLIFHFVVFVCDFVEILKNSRNVERFLVDLNLKKIKLRL